MNTPSSSTRKNEFGTWIMASARSLQHEPSATCALLLHSIGSDPLRRQNSGPRQRAEAAEEQPAQHMDRRAFGAQWRPHGGAEGKDRMHRTCAISNRQSRASTQGAAVHRPRWQGIGSTTGSRLHHSVVVSWPLNRRKGARVSAEATRGYRVAHGGVLRGWFFRRSTGYLSCLTAAQGDDLRGCGGEVVVGLPSFSP